MVGVADGWRVWVALRHIPIIRLYFTGKMADDACDVTKDLPRVDNSLKPATFLKYAKPPEDELVLL
jgi:hypothetical protein